MTTDPLNVMLVGCGLMGARHVRGYAELERVRYGTLRLVCVCDPVHERADAVCGEAETLLGYRPRAYPTVQHALASEPFIEAADVVTGNRSHDTIGVELLRAGVHCLVEKPLALTVARGQAMVREAAATGRVLAVAENNRYDPLNRLCRHVLQAGLLGESNFVLMTSIIAGRQVIATPWRHAVANGGLALDVGIHQGYMLEAFLGPIQTICAIGRQVWPTRISLGPAGEETEYSVDADDLFVSEIIFESGAYGSWVMHFGATGTSLFQRIIFGASGSLETSPDRSGAPPRLRREDAVLEGDALLESLPEFHLNEIESLLWGDRIASYSLPYPEIDRKLIASEVWDFADAIRRNRKPEVTGEKGLRSVAIMWALLESVAVGRAVTVQDVLNGEITKAQAQAELAET